MILPNYTLNQGKNYLLQKFSLRFNFLIPKPLDLIIFLTYRCNLRCKYCSSWKGLKRNKELSIADWKSIILQFQEWVGPYHLTLTGGEPFKSASILPLIKFLQNKKNIKTSILTNGSLLNKNLCDRIINSRINDITISVNSLNPDIQDFLTGKKGLCQKIKKNIKLLKDSDKLNKMKLYIATIINEMNLEELPRLVEYTKEMNLQGIKFQMINSHTVNNKNYDPNWYNKTQFWPQNSEKFKKILEELIKMKKIYPIWNSKKQLKTIEYFLKNPSGKDDYCTANRKNICVDPYGNLGFCELKNKFSNIHNQKIKEFWYSKRIKEIRREKCNRTCKYLNSNLDKGPSKRIKELIVSKESFFTK